MIGRLLPKETLVIENGQVLAKRCNKCLAAKPLSEFHQSPRHSAGVYPSCRLCFSEIRSRNYQTDPDQKKKRLQRDRRSNEIHASERAAQSRAYYRRTGWRPPPREPEKIAATKALANAIRRAVLVRPTLCSQCGTQGKIEGHHEDYTKPLDVIWLCRRCHRGRHRRS